MPHTRDLTDQGFSVMEAAGAADVRAVMSGLAGLAFKELRATKHVLGGLTLRPLREMTEFADLLRIVRAAEAACTVVVKHPEDARARESLMSALKSLAATLIEEVGPQTEQLGESLMEIQVWADIVRTRIIAITPTRKNIHALQAVRHPAGDLLQMLRRLAGELDVSFQ